MKKNSPTFLGFKIVLLALALIGVFYVNEKLRSRSQTASGGASDPLALLVGGEVGRPLNWCPEDVSRLVIEGEPAETVSDSTQIQSYCQTLSESFDSSKVDLQSFKPVMRAFTRNEKERVLEVDASGQVFRFQGLPFGSKQLTRELEKKFRR
jgi:hypothetical protein